MQFNTFINNTEVDASSLLFNVDTYKVGMHKQYPPGTTKVYSYISSRGGKHDEVVMFGLQYFINEYLSKPITRAQVEAAAPYWEASGSPLPKELLFEMIDTTGGYWPVNIEAVAEGTIVPVKNVLAVVYNTDPRFYWAVTWIETALLRAVWYPSTIATNSREMKKTIMKYLIDTGSPETINYKLHDFGARGASCFEASAIGAAAHLVNFNGTDTMVANLLLNKHYGTTTPLGVSIPASEHSTITSWTYEREEDAYANMVEKHEGMFACVSDSYNIFEACEMWNALAGEIKRKGKTVVVRPDSGDPVEVVLRCLEILERGFGYEKNDKGYKVLNNVRIIWGDGITHEVIEDILKHCKLYNWSADNLAFGIGGGLLQDVVRDDQKWAMKASYAVVNGEGVDVFKNPITDPGKKSFCGMVDLYKDDDGNFYTAVNDVRASQLNLVYSSGYIARKTTFEEIRNRAAITQEIIERKSDGDMTDGIYGTGYD